MLITRNQSYRVIHAHYTKSTISSYTCSLHEINHIELYMLITRNQPYRVKNAHFTKLIALYMVYSHTYITLSTNCSFLKTHGY